MRVQLMSMMNDLRTESDPVIWSRLLPLLGLLGGGLVGLSGCGGDGGSPDLSAVSHDLAVEAPFCDDAAAPVQPTFANVSKLFSLRCTICHVGSAVDLTPAHALETLVRRAVPLYEQTDESCGGLLVVPGDASVSYLHEKITRAAPCAGAQMPRTEFASSPLPMCEQRLITDWINAGAPGP